MRRTASGGCCWLLGAGRGGLLLLGVAAVAGPPLPCAFAASALTQPTCPRPPAPPASLAAMTELQREFELATRAEKRQQELQRQRLLKKVRRRRGVRPGGGGAAAPVPSLLPPPACCTRVPACRCPPPNAHRTSRRPRRQRRGPRPPSALGAASRGGRSGRRRRRRCGERGWQRAGECGQHGAGWRWALLAGTLCHGRLWCAAVGSARAGCCPAQPYALPMSTAPICRARWRSSRRRASARPGAPRSGACRWRALPLLLRLRWLQPSNCSRPLTVCATLALPPPQGAQAGRV